VGRFDGVMLLLLEESFDIRSFFDDADGGGELGGCRVDDGGPVGFNFGERTGVRD